MAADEKWYFTKEQLMNAPSRKYGYDADKELSCRQQAANFIQDMGQRLQVTQLCINTAIVYMHRFYMFHSFSQFHRNNMASAALFLAAKVEEQPRKLEHVIKVSQICLHRDMAPPDVKSQLQELLSLSTLRKDNGESGIPEGEFTSNPFNQLGNYCWQAYNEQAQELVVNENILLQTLGFDVAIDHPHTHVVRCCHLVRASKDLAQTSYFMASNSLHLTSMCLQYKPTVVACFCIHLACKWSNWEIPQSTEGKPWFWYIDKTVTQELLEQLTDEFLVIFEKCPSRLKKKIVSLSQSQNPTILSQFNSAKDEKKRNGDGSLSGAVPSGSNSANEELKKKAEFQRHHPPDYKKHHMSHHSRPDGLNVSSKSSCMFGPPQRTSSSHQSRSMPKTTSVPDVSNLGKPEHLHHRPRRPEDKHPRNHEHIPPPYKKFDKVPSGVVNESPQTGPNVSSRSAVNYSTTTPSSYQMAQQPSQVPMHPLAAAIPEQNVKDTIPLLPSVPKSITPLAPKTKVSPPPTIKIERSIFSPEKCTPPPESLVKPLPPTPPPVTVEANANFLQKIPSIKEEFITPKQEPIMPVDIKRECISPMEEKPPDLLSIKVEEPEPVQLETIPSLITPSQSQVPQDDQQGHKEKKEKKKKKHKEHKEHKDHKDKHKDKHKHKHKNRDPEPIVITIPKEKLTLPPPEQGLKLKIPRDKISTPIPPVESPFKIKISHGKIKESKKRDRSEERSPGLPTKYHRPNGTTTLQVNNELDILDCSSVQINNIRVEVHSPPSVLLDDVGISFDDDDDNLSPSSLTDFSNSLNDTIRSDDYSLLNHFEDVPEVTNELDILDCSSVQINNVRVEVHSPPSVLLDDPGISSPGGLHHIDEEVLMNTSHSVEKPRSVEKSRSVEKLRPVNKPRSVDKPRSKSRSTEKSRSIEKPHSMDKSKSVEKLGSAEKSQSVEKPRFVEKQQCVETPLSTEKVRSKVKKSSARKSKSLEKPLPVDKSWSVEMPLPVDKSWSVVSPLPAETPRSVEKSPVENSCAVEKPRSMEQPPSVDDSRSAETPLSVDKPQSVQKTLTVENSSPAENLLLVEDSPSMEKPLVEKTRYEEKPLPAGKPRTVEKPRYGDKPYNSYNESYGNPREKPRYGERPYNTYNESYGNPREKPRYGGKPYNTYNENYSHPRTEWPNKYPYSYNNQYVNKNNQGNYRGGGGYRGGTRGGYREFPGKSWPPRPPSNYPPRIGYNMQPRMPSQPIRPNPPQPIHQPHQQHYYQPYPPQPNVPQQYYQPQPTIFVPQFQPAPPLPDEPPPEIPPPPPPE